MQRKDRPDGSQEEIEAEAPLPPPSKARRRRPRAFGFVSVFSIAVALLVFFVLALAVSGRTVTVPNFVKARVEAKLNAQMPGAPIELGSMAFGVDRAGRPQVLMNDIRFSDRAGGAVAELNWLGAELSLEDLLKGEVSATSVYLTGAQVTLRRTRDGRFSLAAASSLEETERSVSDLLAEIDKVMRDGALGRLEQVVAGGVVVTLEDAQSGRIWQATNATATLRVSDEALSLSVTSDVFNGTDDLAGIQFSLNRSRVTEHVTLGANLTGVTAGDIAAQSPILSWLSVLDGTISGAVRTEFDELGGLTQFAGTLEIIDGALQPDADVPPVIFDAAKAYFTFDPSQQRIEFSEISFGGESGQVVATGHSYLSEFDGRWPQAFIGQYQIDQVEYADPSLFDAPVALDNARADLRIRLDPFTVELGQGVLDAGGAPVTLSGRISADDLGWHGAVDARTAEIASAQVLEFWPRDVSKVTRSWLLQNLSTGTLRNTSFGVRFDTGVEPDILLSFEFDGGTARFLPEMPPIKEAGGLAVLHGSAFTLDLQKGEIKAPDGSVIDAGGSRFSVPNVDLRPSTGHIDVVATGSLQGMLGVLDNPPLRLLERADEPVDLAEAQTLTTAQIVLPLKAEIENDEVDFNVRSVLRDVTSELLVPGRQFAADELILTADWDQIALAGDVTLDNVPAGAEWVQPIGAGARAGAITGTVPLSSETLRRLGIDLPEGMISGEGIAEYSMSTSRKNAEDVRLTVTSDLRGVGLAIPELGWRKARASAGSLQLEARLGDVPVVEAVSITAPDFRLEGSVALTPAGGLGRATLETLRIGSWLNAEVALTPRANGRGTDISVSGGTLDMRQLNLAGGGGGGGSTAVSLALDRLTVSDGIALAPLRGRLQMNGSGVSGSFDARVNGKTPVKGVLSPANAGTGIRITSSNAAGVLRDAGLTPNAQSGTLDLVLTPVAGTDGGTFDGEFLIENVRLKDAPAMAELLDAISVVGLIDQLSGPGIRFDSVDGRFRLDKRQLRLRRAAAIGPSIGISADGLYDLRSDRMDFKGVVSPVYFLNGIGSILTRRGEGLFGFQYRMRGTAADPNVGVNPLSILTPGAFRQIFRRAPPGG